MHVSCMQKSNFFCWIRKVKLENRYEIIFYNNIWIMNIQRLRYKLRFIKSKAIVVILWRHTIVKRSCYKTRVPMSRNIIFLHKLCNFLKKIINWFLSLARAHIDGTQCNCMFFLLININWKYNIKLLILINTK